MAKKPKDPKVAIKKVPVSREIPEQKTKQHLQQECLAVNDLPHVLLAEDDYEMRSLLAQSLVQEGYNVTECLDGLSLLDYLRSSVLPAGQGKYDLVISDIRMPGLSGLEILERMRHLEGFPPMILITAFGEEEIHAKAHRLGAAAILDKPFEIDELLMKVRQMMPSQPRKRTAYEEPGVIVGNTHYRVLRIEKTIKADVKAITPVIDRMTQIVTKMGRASGKEFELALALREALTNAVVHGCKGDSSKLVHLCVTCDQSGVVSMVVRDPGPGFDHTSIPSPVKGKNIHSEHGRGLFLIKQLMDKVWFEHGGREIHMQIEGNDEISRKMIDGILGSIIDDWYKKVSKSYLTDEQTLGALEGREKEELKRFHDKHGHRIRFDKGALALTYGLRCLWERRKFVIEISVNNKVAGFDYEDFRRQLSSHYSKLKRERVPAPDELRPRSYGEIFKIKPSLFTVEKRKGKATIMRMSYSLNRSFLKELTPHRTATKKLIDSYCVSPFRSVYARVLRRKSPR